LASQLGIDLHGPRRALPNRHDRVQHLQDANGTRIDQADHPSDQAARSGIRANARSCRFGALQQRIDGCNMKVRVKLFAVAKELAARDELTIDVPTGATVSDLRDAVAAASPALAQIVPHALWAVGAEYANGDTRLNERSEV